MNKLSASKCIMLALSAGLILNVNTVAAEATLLLKQAEQIALQRDPVLQAFNARSNAYQEQAEAEDAWPDPRIKLGWMNFPTDTYDRRQEAMTQLQVGVEQMIPRGDVNGLKSRRASDMAHVQLSGADERQRKVRDEIRRAWLELFYWERTRVVVTRNRGYFSKLVDITQSQYAAGRQKQQDVIRAQLELGMLDDRLSMIDAKQESSRAELEKWLGPELARLSLPETLPALPGVQLDEQQVLEHPVLKAEEARVLASERGVALARQGYKPQWKLGVTYGQRDGVNPNGSERADFVSGVISFDLPFATGFLRQGHKVAASKLELDAARQTRIEKERELKRMWNIQRANWQRLGERVTHYDNLLIPKARENAKAAMSAYQSRRGDFTALMRAQITELETLLKGLRLKVDHKKTQAKLLYLAGEPQ